MRIYDLQIERIRELLNGKTPKVYACSNDNCWEEALEYEMIFLSDTAYELGKGIAAVNLTCVTDDPAFINKDEIAVYGRDLSEIDGTAPYARITEVLVKETPEESDISEADKLYKILQDIDFVKYHIYTKGFMVRTSGQSSLEKVRVSKKAIKDNISFEKIGNTYIRHYKENPNVLAVRISFITTEDVDFGELKKEADTVMDIRNSLSMINKGLPTECGSCEIKDICNEIEGLKELHFGQKQKKKIEKSPITQALGRT